MTAFLKIDRCIGCGGQVPWDWIPPQCVGGVQLPGTGVWRRSTVDELCASCAETRTRKRAEAALLARLKQDFIRITGGPKAYREFTLDRYRVTSGNQMAVQFATEFDPAKDNLYLWGPCGVGKTHLAIAIARRWFARGASLVLATPFQLVRRLRMKPPEDEQQAINELVMATILVLDDLGMGSDSAYAKQAVQEILDARDACDRRGLLVTTQYSLRHLSARLGDNAIPSRLGGICRSLEIRGTDMRLQKGDATRETCDGRQRLPKRN